VVFKRRDFLNWDNLGQNRDNLGQNRDNLGQIRDNWDASPIVPRELGGNKNGRVFTNDAALFSNKRGV